MFTFNEENSRYKLLVIIYELHHTWFLEIPLCDEYAHTPVADCITCAKNEGPCQLQVQNIRWGVHVTGFPFYCCDYSGVLNVLYCKCCTSTGTLYPCELWMWMCACGISNANEISYIQCIHTLMFVIIANLLHGLRATFREFRIFKDTCNALPRISRSSPL